MTESKAVAGDGDAVKPASCMGVRHLQVFLLFLATLLGFSMRVNMSMAIVSMTDNTSDDSFSWSMQTQSVILSSFFWGYVVLQIPAGEVASRCGGKFPILLLIAINSVVSLGLPSAAYYGGWEAVCACRVIQGLSQGFMYPSVHCLIGKWAPLTEKSRLGTFVYAGGQFGTALQLMISGFIADSWGWPAIFYVNGILGAIWVVVYFFLGSSDPKSSRIISETEKHYIETSLGQVGEQKKVATPWKSIFTSLPFWSLLLVHCGQNWGFYTLMTEIPSYMSSVLGVNIKANGAMSTLPYLAMSLMSFPFGFFSDYFLEKNWLSITACRKLSNTIGLWGPAIALLGLSYSPAGDVTTAVALLTLTVGLNAGHYTGYLLVHIDMAPQFAGTLMGITNCVANVISIIAPLVAGAILIDETFLALYILAEAERNYAPLEPLLQMYRTETSQSDWRKVFYVASAIYIVFNGIFLLFGSSERQKWNEPQTDTSTTELSKAEKAV